MNAAARIAAIVAAPEAALAAAAAIAADDLLAIGEAMIGEAVLGRWLVAHGATLTEAPIDGFRLLALHRPGARGDPGFNACRELVCHHNLVRLDPAHRHAPWRLRLGEMVVRHHLLFIDGKFAVAEPGEFCSSSRPWRPADAAIEA